MGPWLATLVLLLFAGGCARPVAAVAQPVDEVEQPTVVPELHPAWLDKPADPDQIRADVRAQIRMDPAKALLDLGLQVGEFDLVAKALYARWRIAFPADAARYEHPPPPPVAPIQPRQPDPQPAPRGPVVDAEEQHRWWCYASADSTMGNCSETLVDCDVARASVLNPAASAKEPCPYGLTTVQCNEIATDVAAKIHAVRSCAHQSQAACFRAHRVLLNDDIESCTPTIRLCKQRRDYARKNLTDDIKLNSDCYNTY